MTAKLFLTYFCLACAGVCLSVSRAAEEQREDMTEQLKQSLVYLQISSYPYDQHRPWKRRDVSESSEYGCAVGPYEVLTTAYSVTDATFIKVRRYEQNEFIPATIKAADYESNLCLLELDPNAMTGPLAPLTFSEDYRKGVEVISYRLSRGRDVYSGRGYIDRAEISKSPLSYGRFLSYVIKNTSQRTGSAEIYLLGSKPIGLARWASPGNEAGIIPAEVINHFLEDAADGHYDGFPAIGFSTSRLIDPVTRAYLKMPETVKSGVYVRHVYNLGTGSEALKEHDVILAIDGVSLDPYGRFAHPKFERLSYRHLITSKSVGDTITFDIWRDGGKQQLQVKAVNFSASEMLVPYYEYGKQPEYVVTAGFVIQKLTRDYLKVWGKDWPGKVDPHLYRYFRDLAFKPAPERRDIVILSYVLPAEINLGYRGLGRIVIEKFNGRVITSIRDIVEAQRLNSDSKYHVIEFEHDNPVVVFPRENLDRTDALIARTYGIPRLVHVEP